LIEQIANGELEISKINDKILEELIYCIFPGGNTSLHLLVKNPQALQDLLAKAHQGG
jgi:hypothetical protein